MLAQDALSIFITFATADINGKGFQTNILHTQG